MVLMKIGNVEIKGRTVLAPMAGVNCMAFRVLCKEHGAGLIVTQLLDCDGVCASPDHWSDVIDLRESERPLSVQIVGSDKEKMGEAAKLVEKRFNPDIIDINFGCCDKNFLGKKSGAFLSKHPEQIPKIVKSVVENVSVPVTAKIRIGWDEKNINAVEAAQNIESSGGKAVSVHARTRKQHFSGKADWKVIKNVKEKVSIPVIGNGDIFKGKDGERMIEETGCDLVMIGRGSMGNPFIFGNVERVLRGDDEIDGDKVKAFLRFYELYKKQKKQSFSEFQHHAMWFTKGMGGAADMRRKITGCEEYGEIVQIFDKIK